MTHNKHITERTTAVATTSADATSRGKTSNGAASFNLTSGSVDWIRVGRPGALSVRKHEVMKNLDTRYGVGGWRIRWNLGGRSVDDATAVAVYDEGYRQYFVQHPDELDYIAEKFADVYDNNPSNVRSGCDYTVQEFGGNHYQDIAVRRCLARDGRWFSGEGLLEIRTTGEGKRWGPGELPFHLPHLLPSTELPGWWKPGSIESWYQSAKYLEITDPSRLPPEGLCFVTTNNGKYESARRALGDSVHMTRVSLDIDEDRDDVVKVATHKARVAYSVLCRPVIADDSGFEIPSLGGWPGHHVARELAKHGIERFLAIAKDAPVPCRFVQALAYHDERHEKPAIFLSTTEGTLIGELRGDRSKPFVKSDLGLCFVPLGSEKTVAEMGEEEYRARVSTDRWRSLREYLHAKDLVSER